MAAQTSLVSLVCAFCGLLLIAGGILLLWARRIEFEKDPKSSTVLKLPFGSLTTNQSAIVLFAIGAVLAGYPVLTELRGKEIDSAKGVDILGSVDSEEVPVIVYAVVAEQTMLGDKQFRLTVPPRLRGGPGYELLVMAGKMTDKKIVELGSDGRPVKLDAFQFVKPPGAPGDESNAEFIPDTSEAVPAAFTGGD